MDDFSISFANVTIESHERLDLYGCDELFAALKLIPSAVQADGKVEVGHASGIVLSGRLPAGLSLYTSGQRHTIQSAKAIGDFCLKRRGTKLPTLYSLARDS